MGRYGEIWGGMARYGEIWGGAVAVGRVEQVRVLGGTLVNRVADLAHTEIWGDMARYGLDLAHTW